MWRMWRRRKETQEKVKEWSEVSSTSTYVHQPRLHGNSKKKQALYERSNRDAGGVDCEEGTRVAEPINTLERKASVNAVMKLSAISTTCS